MCIIKALKARYEAHKDHYKLQFSGAENELRFEVLLLCFRGFEKLINKWFTNVADLFG